MEAHHGRPQLRANPFLTVLSDHLSKAPPFRLAVDVLEPVDGDLDSRFDLDPANQSAQVRVGDGGQGQRRRVSARQR